MTYRPTIGLETHVQLSTASKAFCGDRNHFGAEPNRHISPVSLGYPGTLPMLNEAQVEAAVKLGLALGCEINLRSTFDRKNYFYADLPKGYQITQDEHPICLGGRLPLFIAGNPLPCVTALHHIHMEEDAGKSIHTAGESFTRVDLNRAGTPLLEVVTEPDLESAEEVDAFMSGMRQLVRWLGISDGNMQEGSLRCDVNISVRPEGQTEFGTRCEIKNMNSMRYARRAIAYEVARQINILDGGGQVQQQTRQFDPATGKTSALRDKEDAHDYRYFPDPDLPPVVLTQEYVDRLRAGLGILPWEARAQLVKEFELEETDAALISEDKEEYLLFLDYAAATDRPRDLGKLWLNKLLPYRRERSDLPLTPTAAAQLLDLVAENTVSASNASGPLLSALLERPNEHPAQLAESLGLVQNTDDDFLSGVVDEVLAAHPGKVAAYRKGKKGLMGFFMGQVMQRTGGSAEPRATQQLLGERLS